MAVRSRVKLPLSRIMRWSLAALRAAPMQSLSLARLQLAKEFFNVLHPGIARGNSDGSGHSLRLIGLRITDVCNLRCHTCGQWGDHGYLKNVPLPELRRRELPVAVYHRLIDEVAQAGWRPVWYIWGGEPLLYPDIEEVLMHIASLKMPISLVTNGTSLARYAALLAETCSIVHVSIDGASPRVHNACRPGATAAFDSFAHCTGGLQALYAARSATHGFPLLAPITCISEYNWDDVPAIYTLLHETANLHVFYYTWWIDAAALAEHSADFANRFGQQATVPYSWRRETANIEADRLADRVAEVHRLASASSGAIPVFLPPLRAAKDIRAYYANHRETFGYDQCVSIYMTAEIGPNGDVSLCRDYSDFVLGNVASDSIRTIWNGPRAREFRSSISNHGLLPVCRRCCGLMGF